MLAPSTPPARGFAERWVIALVVAFVFIPVFVGIVVTFLWALGEVWFVTVPIALLAGLLALWRWRRLRPAASR